MLCLPVPTIYLISLASSFTVGLAADLLDARFDPSRQRLSQRIVNFNIARHSRIDYHVKIIGSGPLLPDGVRKSLLYLSCGLTFSRAALATAARRAAKCTNKAGDPISVTSKILDVIPDPLNLSRVYISESGGLVRRVDLEVSSGLLFLAIPR
jgi:hypothetical protein